jgi:WD40 repeat protein
MPVRPVVLILLCLASCGRAAEPVCLGDDGFRIGEEFSAATLAPDGKSFAVLGRANRFYVLDALGQVAWWRQGPASILALDFDEAGRLLVFDAGGWLRTFESQTGRELSARLLPLPAPGFCRFEARGRYLSFRSGSNFRETDLIDLATGQPLSIPFDLDGMVAVFSPDGRYLLGWPSKPDGQPLSPGIRPRLPGWPAPPPEERDFKKSWGLLRRTLARSPVLVDLTRAQARGVPLVLPPGLSLVGFLHDEFLFWKDDQFVAFHPVTGALRTIFLDGFPAESPFESCLSPDGQRIAIRCGQSSGEWELASGQRLRTWAPADSWLMGYTPEGRLLTWNYAGHRLQVVQRNGGLPPLCRVGHLASLRDLRFTPDSRVLESIDAQGRLVRWSVPQGSRLGEELVAVFFPARDGRGLYPAGILGFDPTGDLVRLEEFVDSTRFVFSRRRQVIEHRSVIQLEPRGRCDSAGWDLGGPENGPLRLHGEALDTPIPLPPRADLWREGKMGYCLVAHRAGADNLAVITFLGEWGEEGQRPPVFPGLVTVLEIATGRVLQRWPVSVWGGNGMSLLATDGDLLAIPFSNGVRVHTMDGTVRSHISARSSTFLRPLAFSPDHRSLLVLANTDTQRELRLVELATGTTRQRWTWRTLAEPTIPPLFSPDGRHIAYPKGDGTILLLATDAPAQALDPATIWRDLSSRDAAVANVAVQALAARPGARQEIAARGHWLAAPVTESVDLLSLLPDLDADEPARREAAQRRLRHAPTSEVEALLRSLPAASLEVRRALRDRLDVRDVSIPTSCELRRLRVAEVLERLARRE